MSHSFDMIRAIDRSKETFKPGVQIVDIWFDQVHQKYSHLKMVLMDGKFDQVREKSSNLEMVLMDGNDGDVDLNASQEHLINTIIYLLPHVELNSKSIFWDSGCEKSANLRRLIIKHVLLSKTVMAEPRAKTANTTCNNNSIS
ncbi:hypothetical protein JHK85_023330 [Glycine max]|nr:hypothetical protein JHK85_023330 [Glycine max]KAG5026951.1 hypothetical protein JHK86_022865 [Glycine max]